LERLIIVTEDGSHTVLAREINEHYHSVHGALQESMHIFIHAGLHQACIVPGELNILEIGFGTGLNVLLTLADPTVGDRKVNYLSLEPYPLSFELAAELNYNAIPGLELYREDFLNMHLQPFGIEEEIRKDFCFTKLKMKAEQYQFQPSTYHLVYFDAFSPDIQPELWAPEIFLAIYKCMKPGGILVTYCAKGSVKRLLKSIGFRVEILPGPPGKNQITRAVKDISVP
jgi:tRNA U34 5-methylaminomethyl-2-thiouridine-forming methyltransferase MnmC